MTGPFTFLLVLLAGSCLLPSAVHLRLWWRNRQDLTQLWFTLLGVGVASYILFSVGLYASRDVEDYHRALGFRIWASPVVLISLLGLARGLARASRPSRVEWILSAAIATFPFVRILDPWYFTFHDVTGLGHRLLLGGESIAVLRGASQPLGGLAITLLYFGAVLVMVWRTRTAWREKRNSAAGFLFGASGILLISGAFDIVVIVRVLPLPFLTDPALASVVLLLGWKMQGDLFRANELRLEVEAGKAVLSILVEHASDLVARLDPAGVVTYASPSAGRFVEGGASAIVGRRWNEQIVPHHRAVFEACLQRLRLGAIEERISYAVLSTGESGRWVESILGAHRDKAGNLIEFHGVTRDIDEAMAREERLETLEGELREINATLERRVQRRTEELSRTIRDLEAFASTASHDLKAPLRAMSGYAAALEEDHAASLPPEGRHWLSRIRESSIRLGNLIESLLELARTGQRILERQPTDLAALSREIVDALRAAEPERVVECSIAPDLVADCDPVMARTILENLLGNSWKYSSKGERTVIEVGRDPEGWFFVRDEGAGFDMRFADQLFLSFQRLHRAEEFEGNGIGLASVRRMLDLHGGDIQATSEPGKGAIFRFHFGNRERST